jgi:hypothetical protein
MKGRNYAGLLARRTIARAFAFVSGAASELVIASAT